MWSWQGRACCLAVYRGFQLHISGGLQRLQRVEGCGVFVPGCMRLAWNGFDPRNGLPFHLQIDFRVMIRRGWTGMTQIVANGGQIDSRLQKRYRRAVPHAVRMKPLLAEMRNILGGTGQTPTEDVADPEPGQRSATMVQERTGFYRKDQDSVLLAELARLRRFAATADSSVLSFLCRTVGLERVWSVGGRRLVDRRSPARELRY